MQKIIILLLIISSSLTFSQNKESEKILNEGKLLFRLEKGSWYGTDDMLVRFKSKKDSIGGYLSYENEDNKINTIFFSRFDSNKILVRYEFDSLPKTKPIKIDSTNHIASKLEKSLIKVRKDAQKRAYSNKDKFFKFYENTALNFIPVINEKDSNVFVLTGPQIPGVVLIGNDYKLEYNKKGEFVKKIKIHNSILQFPYKSDNPENKLESTFQSLVLSKFINSTDICTLLLYKDYVEWKQHYAMSKKYVSIFDLEKENLLIITKKAWNKINNHQKDKK